MGALNIAIEIAAKDSGASALINGIKNAMGGLGDLAGGALSLGLGAAAAGVAGLGAGLGLAISEAMGAEAVMAQTEAVIASTGGAAGMTADAIADLATELSHSSRFAGDAIQEGENLLLTFTNIGSETFPMATQAMVDMATAMGTDVKGGAIQLGKALNDPVAGISALSRVGVTFTEDQKKVIESLVETGDVAGAQKIILDELNREFGGSAAAAAQTLAGRMDVMKNRLLDVAEAIGGPLLTVGMDLMDRFLTPVIPVIEAIGGAFTDFIGSIMTGEDPMGSVANLAYAVANALGLDGNGLFASIIALRDPFDNFIAALGSVWTSLSSIDFGPLLTAFGDLIDALGIQFPSAGDTMNGVADGIKVAAQGLADFMNNILLPAVTAVVNWFTENWPAIKATGEQVMSGLQTAIETVLNGIQSFWAEWGDEITAAWENYTQNIQQIFDIFKLAFEGKWYEFGQALRTAFDESWEQIKGLAAAAMDWFTTQDWGQIGKDILQGIANGISAGASIIKDAATAAAKAAYEAVKGFLGIKSPSTKFFELGEYSGMGFVQGIGSMAPAMAYAGTNAATNAYNGAAGVAAGGGAGGIVIHIDARGASDLAATEAAAERGARKALKAAGIRADQIRRIQ